MTERKSEKTTISHVDARQPRSSLVGFDNLLEDVFGLNIRACRSIGILLVRPLEYFQAAKDSNWLWRFTPSFRVWFGISALTAALRFLWAGPDSPSADVNRVLIDGIIQKANTSLAANNQTLVMTDAMRDAAAADILKWMLATSPFVMAILIALFAIIYRAWGERLTYVVRLRYLFAILVTGSFLGFLSAFLMMLIPNAIYQQVNFILLFGMFGLYFYTAYQGPYKSRAIGPRIGLSSLLTLCLSVLVSIGILISISIAIWFVVTYKFPEPTPLIP
ncbi:MAG: hypothetical protein ABJN22_09520 [Litorimonas sp.]